jgi:hypothetical protein
MTASTPAALGTPTVESADTTIKSEAPTPTIVTKARISHQETTGGFPIKLLETLVSNLDFSIWCTSAVIKSNYN